MRRTIIHKGIARACFHGYFNWLPDAPYLHLIYWSILGKSLRIDNPLSFNEKIQWLKLYDRNEKYIKLVDKYAVREYIAATIGKQYLIPLVGGPWKNVNDIVFEELPEKFVLKTTHDSGGVVVCSDKESIDWDIVKRKIERSMQRNYYKVGREWPYNSVVHQIIAEQYMVDDSGRELKDYKILCFNGTPVNVMVCTGRMEGNVKYYFFDKEWNFLPYNKGDDKLPKDFTLTKPTCLNEMFDIAKKLSEGIPLVRVDLYQVDGNVYFGELTFYPDSGLDIDITQETDYLLGNMLELPDVKCCW